MLVGGSEVREGGARAHVEGGSKWVDLEIKITHRKAKGKIYRS